MAKIISLRGDQHHQVFDLLPWYATGQLDPADLAQVEAHLDGCADCQGELKFQRQLASALSALPIVAEDGWPAMRQRLEQEERDGADADRRNDPLRERFRRGWRANGPWLGWAAAAGVALALSGVLLLPSAKPAAYHALGAAPANPACNAIIAFRPDTTEHVLRDILNEGHARLVDGPTASGAFVLHIAPSDRPDALARLRRRPEVTSAEPIDSGAPP